MFCIHSNTVWKYFFALRFGFLVFWPFVLIVFYIDWIFCIYDHMNKNVVKDKFEFRKLLPGWLDFMWVIRQIGGAGAITGELIV